MDELDHLRKLAGVDTAPAFSFPLYSKAERQKYIQEDNIKPGTPEWFRAMFAKPELTGETPW